MALACFRTISRPSGRTSQTGVPLHEPAHVLPPNQRDVFPEFLHVQLDKAPPVAGFLLAHAVRRQPPNLGNFPAILDKIGVDTFIFFSSEMARAEFHVR